jgi:phospholipid/cholesterol/gamma-HCH transport system ATP-binding protein
LWQVADRVAVLAEGRVQGIGTMAELSRMDHPAIRQFFDGPRGRAAQEQEKRQPEVQGSGKTGRPPSKPK